MPLSIPNASLVFFKQNETITDSFLKLFRLHCEHTPNVWQETTTFRYDFPNDREIPREIQINIQELCHRSMWDVNFIPVNQCYYTVQISPTQSCDMFPVDSCDVFHGPFSVPTLKQVCARGRDEIIDEFSSLFREACTEIMDHFCWFRFNPPHTIESSVKQHLSQECQELGWDVACLDSNIIMIKPKKAEKVDVFRETLRRARNRLMARHATLSEEFLGNMNRFLDEDLQQTSFNLFYDGEQIDFILMHQLHQVCWEQKIHIKFNLNGVPNSQEVFYVCDVVKL